MTATPVQRPLHVSLMMMGAGLMLATMMVFAKLAAQTHAIIEVTFFRNLIGAACMAAIVARRPGGFAMLATKRPVGHLVRAVLGLVGLCLNFWAAKLLPLAEQTALFFAMPLMLTLLSIPFLKETVDWRRWVGVVLGFMGILVIARPTGDASPLGVLVALGGAFFTALVGISVRRLGSSEPERRTVFWFFILSTLMSGALLPWFFTMPSTLSFLYLAAAGVVGTVGQLLLTSAYARAPAGFLSPFNYIAIIYTTTFGWLVWGDWPRPAVFAGAFLVVAAGFLTIVLERGRKAAGPSLDKRTQE